MTRNDRRFVAITQAADALAGDLDLSSVLERIVQAAAAATGARYAALGVVGENQQIEKFVYHGIDEETAKRIGHLPTGGGLLGLLIRDPRLLRTDEIAAHPSAQGFPEGHPPMHSFLGVPVRSRGRVFGNLYLTEKPGGFDVEDEDLVRVLAAHAGHAIENVELAERLQSLAVQDERDRISRELHDGVIQSLFSIGMGLESARSLVDRDPVRVTRRLDEAVDALDDAIRELRNYIFHLRPQQAATMGLERGITELAREYEVNAVVRPHLDVSSGLDTRVPEQIVPDLLQIVREVLSNCAKHADASMVELCAFVEEGSLELSITDDGRGFDPGSPRVGRGLDNIRERADALGAHLAVDSAPGAGAVVRLRVPVEERG